MALSNPVAGGAQNAAPLRGPAWVTPLYFVGLVLIYVGERVLSGLEHGARVFTVLGAVAVLVATVCRYLPQFRGGEERRSIESLLGALSIAGIVGLIGYYLTSDAGILLLGLDKASADTREHVQGFGHALWVALILLCVVPMIFAESALLPMRKAERPESRRVRSAIVAGLSLALAAVYCALFVFAASGIDLHVDYSYFKTSQPSESTRKMVQALDEPLKVTAFFPDVNDVRGEIDRYLKNLAHDNPKLQVKIADRLLAPKLARDLHVNQDGVVILEKGPSTQQLTLPVTLEEARPKLKTFDRDFQEQLAKVALTRRVVYLTTGHGEVTDAEHLKADRSRTRSGQILRALLQRQNYTIKDLGLGQGLATDVPRDADVVLILGPTEPLSREELASLRRFANRGGHMLIALDVDAISENDLASEPNVPGEGTAQPPGGEAPKPAGSASAAASAKPGEKAPPHAAENAAPAPPPSNPALDATYDELASIGGVKFSHDVLANEKVHVRVRFNDSDRTRLVTTSFSSHASVSLVSRSGRAPVMMFGAGSLEKGDDKDAKADFMIRSLPNTFQDKNRNYQQDPNSEPTRTFNFGAAVTKPATERMPDAPPDKDDKKKKKDKDADKKKPDSTEMRAIVLADSDALSDFVMGEVAGNRMLFVNAMQWLGGEDVTVGLPNTEEDVKIEHTKQGDLGWFYATIFGAPGLVLGVGLFIGRSFRRGGTKQ